MSKDPAEFPREERLIITVAHPPGGSDPVHRHNAHGFIYLPKGSVVMQVKGGKEITLTPGQSFYETRWKPLSGVSKCASSGVDDRKSIRRPLEWMISPAPPTPAKTRLSEWMMALRVSFPFSVWVTSGERHWVTLAKH